MVRIEVISISRVMLHSIDVSKVNSSVYSRENLVHSRLVFSAP